MESVTISLPRPDPLCILPVSVSRNTGGFWLPPVPETFLWPVTSPIDSTSSPGVNHQVGLRASTSPSVKWVKLNHNTNLMSLWQDPDNPNTAPSTDSDPHGICPFPLGGCSIMSCSVSSETTQSFWSEKQTLVTICFRVFSCSEILYLINVFVYGLSTPPPLHLEHAISSREGILSFWLAHPQCLAHSEILEF